MRSQDAARADTAARKPKIVNLPSDEFDISKCTVSTKALPSEFTSPPLMPGLLQSIHSVLGPDARPTPISLKHLFTEPDPARYHEHFLASETGS